MVLLVKGRGVVAWETAVRGGGGVGRHDYLKAGHRDRIGLTE